VACAELHHITIMILVYDFSNNSIIKYIFKSINFLCATRCRSWGICTQYWIYL